MAINYYYNSSNARLLLLIIASAPERVEKGGTERELEEGKEAEGGDRRGTEEGR